MKLRYAAIFNIKLFNMVRDIKKLFYSRLEIFYSYTRIIDKTEHEINLTLLHVQFCDLINNRRIRICDYEEKNLY